MTKIITLMVTFVIGSTMPNDHLEERGEIFLSKLSIRFKNTFFSFWVLGIMDSLLKDMWIWIAVTLPRVYVRIMCWR